MGRIFGILLIVVAVWYGVEQLGAGMGEDETAAATPEQARRNAPGGHPADSAHRAPVTQRVRDRVTGAMQEGARRRAGPR